MIKHFLSTSTLALLTAAPALADVTAQDVWTDWQSYMKGFGYEMSGSESTSGNTLTVADATMSFEMPEDAGEMTATMGTLTFTNLGDGTVEIGLPNNMPVAFALKDDDKESFSGTLNYLNEGLKMIVSGDPSDMTYSYTADKLTMTMSDMKANGEAQNIGSIQAVLEGVSGGMQMKIGNLRDMAQKMKVGKLSYTVDIAPEGDDGSFKMNGILTDLAFDGTGAYPTGGFDATNMMAMMKAGFDFAGNFTYGTGQTEVEAVDENGPFSAQSSSQGGNLAVAMSEKGITYGGKALGLKSVTKIEELPFPIEINAEESAFDLKIPVSKSDETQPYRLNILLGEATTSDMIWSMIDPGQQLPRDPATLHLDVSGDAKLFVDFMDTEKMENLDEAPGEIHSANIDTLKLSIAGAELTGKGGFTFDNSDTETIPGIPAPKGAVDLKLVGGNGLIDKLVGMGLLPEDQAMGARMMMGLFTIPGEGEDTLNSKIEINEQGHILANGQRLR